MTARIELDIQDSFILRCAEGAYRRFINSAREGFILRTLLSSGILTWFTGRLEISAGIIIGALFIVPHSLFNNILSLLALIFLTVLTLLGAERGRIPRAAFPKMGRYAAAYWLLILTALITSRHFGSSMRFFIFHLTAFLALFVIRSLCADRRRLIKFCAPILAAVSIAGLYGLLQSLLGVEVSFIQVDVSLNERMPGRIYSFFENPNNFAAIIVLTLPFFAAALFMTGSKLAQRLIVLAAVPPAAALVLTYSRSGWMALGLAAVVYLYFTCKWMVPVLMAAALAAVPFLPASISERLLSTFAGTDTSILYRASIRESAYPVLSESWLFGFGLGADAVWNELMEYYREVPRSQWQVAAHMHHLYLQQWVELGIFGMTAFCGAMLTFLKRSAHSLLTSKNHIAAAGLGGISGALLMGFAEYIIFYPRVMLLFWMVIGITFTAVELGKEGQTAP
jgi:O-antigen ligase